VWQCHYVFILLLYIDQGTLLFVDLSTMVADIMHPDLGPLFCHYTIIWRPKYDAVCRPKYNGCGHNASGPWSSTALHRRLYGHSWGATTTYWYDASWLLSSVKPQETLTKKSIFHVFLQNSSLQDYKNLGVPIPRSNTPLKLFVTFWSRPG